MKTFLLWVLYKSTLLIPTSKVIVLNHTCSNVIKTYLIVFPKHEI